jgi:hypothetical protein
LSLSRQLEPGCSKNLRRRLALLTGFGETKMTTTGR